MKNALKWAVVATALTGFMAMTSCKDEEPPIAIISFELEEMEVTESDGTFGSFHPELTDDESEGRVVQVKLLFDRALAGDAVIDFTIGGTALQDATSDEVNDFEIIAQGDMLTVDGEQMTILKGATEALINITIFEDLRFEYDEDVLNDDNVSFETIVITLENLVSGPIRLETPIAHTVKILEDDAVAFLEWEAQDMTPEAAEVDMDILFWLNGAIVWYAARPGSDFEAVNIPAGLGEGDMGISYTYYSGNSDDVDFAGVLFSTAGTLNGQRYTYPEDEPLIFLGNYKQANLNPWDDEGAGGMNPLVAQTMKKSGINYTDFSGLNSFTSGSRQGNGQFKLEKNLLLNLRTLDSKALRSIPKK